MASGKGGRESEQGSKWWGLGDLFGAISRATGADKSSLAGTLLLAVLTFGLIDDGDVLETHTLLTLD